MLPVILAAVGGYLVYDSLKAKKFADGGITDVKQGDKVDLSTISQSLNSNLELDFNNDDLIALKSRLISGQQKGSYIRTSPDGGEIKFEDGTTFEVLKKDGKINVLKTSKTSKKSKSKRKVVGGQSDEELYEALADMGYDFGEMGSEDFDEDGFSETAVNLGYRYDEKKKLWNNNNMMAKGGQTFNDSETDDFYEDLQVYVQGKGSIYKGKSLKEATKAFDDYYAKHPHAEIVMVDEKYGDELKWANVESDNDDEEYRRGGRTKAEITADKRYKALKAGKRVSEDGNVYYESRANRSDVSRRDKLADGGIMAKGGNVRSLSSGIRKYYVEAYPKDDMGADINPKATFKGLLKTLEDKKNVYTYLDVSDSLIRERVFGELSEIMGVKYSKIYNMWLLGDDD